MIGEKIRSLRKNKNLSQMQLAEALFVSSQTVSKWETHLSSPDISLLPEIARFFGITIDELFNYKLEPLTYKERFIRFMIDNGMLRFGEFTLKSGRISPYLIHSGYNFSSSQISKLGIFYSECIKHNNIESNSLIGVNKREVPLVVATSMTLYNKYGIETSHYFDLDIDNISISNKNITLLTDAFTSGATLISEIEYMISKIKKVPTDVIVSVDRMERTANTIKSARQEIESKYHLKIHPIVTAADILNAIEAGVLNNTEYILKMRNYLKKYQGE